MHLARGRLGRSGQKSSRRREIPSGRCNADDGAYHRHGRGDGASAPRCASPSATEEAFKGGYFHSGDLAIQHADGYIQIADRAKDIIISGGENISSVEVESTLMGHDAVLLAAVVAKPDEKWGEVPCAFVELKPGVEVDEATLIAFTRETLAGFKAPKKVVFQELPKTSTGKIQKFELRKLAATL